MVKPSQDKCHGIPNHVARVRLAIPWNHSGLSVPVSPSLFNLTTLV